MPGVLSSRIAQTGDSTPLPIPFGLWDISGSGAGPWVFASVTLDPVLNAQMTPAKDSSVLGFGGSVGTPSPQIQTIQGNASGVAVPVRVNAAQVTVTPAVTVGAYSGGNVIGGIMTFANILPGTLSGELTSLSLTFKATVQTVEFDVAIFSALPTGTFGDHGAPSIATTDSALLVDIFKLTNNLSPLGTHTIYNLDNIGRRLVGTTTSLFAVVTAKSAPVNPVSTSEMSLTIAMEW